MTVSVQRQPSTIAKRIKECVRISLIVHCLIVIPHLLHNVAKATESDFAVLSSVMCEKRRAIKSGVVQLEVKTHKNGEERTRYVTIMFEGDAKRIDIRDNGPKFRFGTEDAREIVSGRDGFIERRIILTDQQFADFFPGTLENQKQLVLRLGKREDADVLEDHFFDPRIIGLIPDEYSAWTVLTLDEMQPRLASVQQVSLPQGSESSKIDGHRVSMFRLHGAENSQDTISYWLALDMGVNPLKIEIVAGEQKTLVNTEYSQEKNSGLWFPKKISVAKYDAGKQILTETCEVKQVSLNTPVDKALFALSGLGIEPGRKVWDMSSETTLNNHLIWSGDALVTIDQIPPPAVSHPHTTLLSVAIGLNIIIGLLLILYFALSRRSHKSEK